MFKVDHADSRQKRATAAIEADSHQNLDEE